MLRKAWPDAIDVDRVSEDYRGERKYVRHSFDDALGWDVVDMERALADRAFRVSLGLSLKDEPEVQFREDMIEDLTTGYERYGLIRGEHEMAVFVRRIEAQAEEQARQLGARGR